MRIKINVEDGKNVFFISDFHLFHSNVIKFDKRPFLKVNGDPDLDTMHKTILRNWNSVVNDNDVVFYLGDLNFANVERAYNIVHALKGEIHFIMGNHDKYKDIVNYKRFASINDYVDLDISGINDFAGDVRFTLMHYPIFSWNKMHHGSYHVHGHCHGNLHHGEDRAYYDDRAAIDVGCNLIDYTPISYTEIINKFQ